MDVLSVLRNEREAPEDLKQRAIIIAGELLELSGKSGKGEGAKMATEILATGLACKKFMDICASQGRFTEPTYAVFSREVLVEVDGMVQKIDNRKIAKLAKLAGAPKSPKAGVLFNAPLNKQVKKGDVLLTIYAETQGELDYTLEYYKSQAQIIEIK
jgi:thymidine phosphorylase